MNFFSAESNEEKSAVRTKLLVEFLFLLGLPRTPRDDFGEKSDTLSVNFVLTSVPFSFFSSLTASFSFSRLNHANISLA